MAIERDTKIKFHEHGTLKSVTRWIQTHDEGIAEWLKNSRRAYQRDRSDVADEHRAAVLLLADAHDDQPARIALLDVGGATLEDVERWSTWQDPEASSRGSTLDEEETQGNGGKAYMYSRFKGPTQILGVRGGRLNRKGMEGDRGSLVRGTPGFIPNVSHGRDLEISSWEAELCEALTSYDCRLDELPSEVEKAIRARQAFTIVEGVDPVNVYKGKLDVEDLIHKLLRHDQSTLAVQQLRLYAVHNGRWLNQGKPLELDPIPPHPGFEQPVVHEIPEQLPDDNGRTQSTTLDDTRPRGRVILHTSRDNMPRKHKELRSRWKVSYRAGENMVGSKKVSELVPNTPGNQFVYATVELSALEPDYVALGRVRPNDGPLLEAVDTFVADCIRELAKQIHEHQRHEMDEQQLDEVQQENRKLDDFKNRFLPDTSNVGGEGPNDGNGGGNGSPPPPPPPPGGDFAELLEVAWPEDQVLRIGRGVKIRLAPLVRPRAVNSAGRTVAKLTFEWTSNDRHVIEFTGTDAAIACGKGRTTISIAIAGTSIRSREIPVEVWNVDHVLLTPRSLDIPLGKRKQIVAEVTNDEGLRATNVLLKWMHDADDPLIVRINPAGWVTGNRKGRTNVTAGAGDPVADGVWARIPAAVRVVENRDEIQRGSGFPQLLLTGRDSDPETGKIRDGDPEQPALWQEVSDFQNNVWWLNLENPAAYFHFSNFQERAELWRSFHAQKVVEMVQQVHMQTEFTQRDTDERRDFWASHKAAMERIEVQLAQMMWEQLRVYVLTGSGID